MGPLTPVIRIWSRLLKTGYDHACARDADTKYFWTIVGYFNAIRELSGGLALYREDIFERLKHISCLFEWNKVPGEDNTRLLDFLSDTTKTNWTEKVSIRKTADGRTIQFTDGGKSLVLDADAGQKDASETKRRGYKQLSI